MKMYEDWSYSSSIYHWNQVKANFMPWSLYHEERTDRKETSVLAKNQTKILQYYSVRKEK